LLQRGLQCYAREIEVSIETLEVNAEMVFNSEKLNIGKEIGGKL
jgi:hypothetical protein